MTESAPQSEPQSDAKARTRVSSRPRRLAFLLLLLLSLQLLLGMWDTLFVGVPSSHPGANASEYFGGVVQGVLWAIFGSGLPALVAHAALGLLLVLASIYLIVVAFRGTERIWKILTPVGAFGILAAGFNGASFMNYGFNVSSLLMTVGFLVALVAYIIGLYASKPAT